MSSVATLRILFISPSVNLKDKHFNAFANWY